MSSVLKQIIDSKTTVLERFKKLYRTLYIQFIHNDIMHKKDLQEIIQQITTRIDTLEAGVNANVQFTHAAIGIAILNHIHQAPQAPAGTLPTTPGIPVGPNPPAAPINTTAAGQATVSASLAEKVLRKRIQEELAKGPATAPLADGIDPQVLQENLNTKVNISLGDVPTPPGV